MKFAVDGDLVCGLASASPPKAFVGELGDDAAQAAAGVVSKLAGPKPGAGPAVTVAGQRLALRTAMATELAGGGLVARPLTWTSAVRVAGTPTLVDQGAFMCTPTGSLQSLALRQGIGAVAAPAGASSTAAEDGAASGHGAPAHGVAPRTDYSPATLRAQILARCSAARAHDLPHPDDAVLVGDPVDVASGSVVLEATDFEHPHLTFRRRYDSHRSDRTGPLGPGWSHNFDVVLWLEPGRVVVRDERGRELEFDCLELRDGVARAGDEVHELAGRMVLVCHGHHHWDLHDGSRVLQFGPIPGTGAPDTDRGMAKLRSIVVPGAPLVELDYDNRARLVDVRAGGKAVIGLRYDADDRIIRLCADAARYEYGETGVLLAVVDADGAKREYEYESDLLVRHTDRRGASFYYAYDGHGSRAKCTRTWGDGGRLHRALSYGDSTTSVTDSHGQRWAYAVDTAGLVTSMVDPVGDAHRYRWDDSLGLARVNYPDQTHAIAARDDDGRVVQQRERDGTTWSMRYDSDGRLVEGVDPGGGVWRFAYDSASRLTRVVDPLDHVTRVDYEGGCPRWIEDPLGRVVQLEVSDEGLVERITEPTGQTHGFGYDVAGRLVRATAPQHETHWRWDRGRLSSIVCGHRAVRLDRDAEGALVGKRGFDAQGEHAWAIRRGIAGSIVAIEDGQRRWSYAHDTEGRLSSVKVDGRTRWETRRDARGRVDAWLVDGSIEGLAIRNAGRLERLGHGEDRYGLEWSPEGRLVRVVAPHGRLEYTYRADGQLIGYAVGESKSSLERNAVGVVVRQQHQAPGQAVVTIDSSSVDHRGNRYGLTVDERVSISHLWRSDGELDRLAVLCNGATYDLDPQPVAGQSRAGRMFDGDGPTVRDALHRPVSHQGTTIVWDEAQIVGLDDAFVVRNPTHGRALALLDATGTHPAPPCPQPDSDPTSLDAVHGACFPDLRFVLERDEASPLALLRRRFGRRVWSPSVRPFPGTHPWDPDDWQPEVPEPMAPSGRLDQRALMRLLSPFPRAPLTLPDA